MIRQNSRSRKSSKNVRTEHSGLARRRFTRLMPANTRDASVGYVPDCSWKGSSRTSWLTSTSCSESWRIMGNGTPNKDSKLKALQALLTKDFPDQKVLIFTQFADTARYLEGELKRRRDRSDRRWFAVSPAIPPSWPGGSVRTATTNETGSLPDKELRVLVATDVLSEGQNLQDASIVVNYDLPWAIIRLIQRAGRVDRIGQKATEILCYTFWPADGVERIIQLRSRVRQTAAAKTGRSSAPTRRSSRTTPMIRPSSTCTTKSPASSTATTTRKWISPRRPTRSGNGHGGRPVSRENHPGPPTGLLCHKTFQASQGRPNGVLLYVRTAAGNDALAWVDKKRQERHGVAVRHPQRRGMHAGNAGLAPPGRPSRARSSRYRADHRGREDRRRSTRSRLPELGSAPTSG